jgi:hypothetical protein
MIKGSDEPEMREERYQAILAAYGADPKNWPAAERAGATLFAAESPAMVSREEAALDALLASYAAADKPADDEAAMARILAGMRNGGANVVRMAPARPVRKAAASNWLGGRRMMAAGFAFAALAGLAIGFADTGGVGLSTADASDELVVSYALAGG